MDYHKLKDILTQLKQESKAEKKSEEWFEWLSWNSSNKMEKSQEKPSFLENFLEKNNVKNPEKSEKILDKNAEKLAEISKKKDYSINLVPINEEMSHKIVQKNRLTEKLKDLDEIKFKNSFIRRNSPKKLFQPLSTLILGGKDEKSGNFNSLQEISMGDEAERKKVEYEPFSLEDGDISPQKLSDKVHKMGVQNFNFK